MAISIICIALLSLGVGAFASFVVFHLREIKAKTDNIPASKPHWSMGIYMNDIPQNEQNTVMLSSVPFKIYEDCDCLDRPIPRVGEKITGVYNSGENKFEMTGVVEDVSYNTDVDWIVVECGCTDIRKIK